MDHSYANSFSYQALMQRAFRSERNFSKGIDNSPFLLLSHIERGHARKPASYQKQVAKIKAYLSKAIAKILKWKLTSDERIMVGKYARMVEQSYNEATLYAAICGLLDATQRFQDY